MKAAAILVVLVAIAFRFLWLDTVPGLNGDEAWLGWKASRAVTGQSLDWVTNTGNFTNPFFLLPLVGLHWLFDPSAWVVRVTAAVSGVVTLFVNFVLCRWLVGRLAAGASSLLLAVVPMGIAYSRFGWEPCQVPLFSVFIVYSSLALSDSRRPMLLWMLMCGLAVGCGFLVHPTMAFLAILPVVAFAARWVAPEKSMGRVGLLSLVAVAVSVLLGGAMYLKAPPWIQPEIAGRFADGSWLSELPRFVVAWLRNFNGINTYGFLPGSWPGAADLLKSGEPWPVFGLDMAVGLFFLMALGVLVWGATRQSSRDGGDEEAAQRRILLVLFVGTLSATLLFGVMNGPVKVAVWFDRYGLWGLVPGCLILGVGFAKGVGFLPRWRGVACWLGLLWCVGMLSLFGVKYLGCFLREGGHGGMDSRVAFPQIKERAAEEIIRWNAGQADGRKVFISADWFVYWPVVYFLGELEGGSDWEFVYAGAEAPEKLRGENRFRERFEGCDVVIAESEGSDAWEQWRKIWPERSWDRQAVVLPDIVNRANLRVDFPNGDRGSE